MADRVGQQLGNYRLIRLLGQGGFANVYLGQHLHLDSQAAIKVMHTHLAQEEWESFRREARMVAGLVHRHIVRLLDFDVEEGTPFLVMQFAPNGTLRRRHAPGLPLLPEIILPYVRQIADALGYVHERKLIHRDIKPENLLLGAENEVLLSDFGVAIIAQTSRIESTENIGGTVAYMAPEQIQSKPCSASDQYALGVVVYEWLTGERPFDGSFTEIASKHILVAPKPLSELAPSVSPAIEEVVLRALAKAPQDRFPSILAFAQALENTIGSDQSATLVARRPALTAASASSTLQSADTTSLSTQALISSPQLSLPGVSTTAAPKRGITRRTVVLGLAGVVAASGGALSWLMLNGSPSPTLAAQATPTPRPTLLEPRAALLFLFNQHTSSIYTVAWSPDGTRIASGGKDGKVLVWDVQTGFVYLTFAQHTKAVNAVAWSPDGTQIASGSSDTLVHVWEASSGTIKHTYKGHQSFVGTLCWSPDGTKIASGSGDPYQNLDHTVHVWNVLNGHLLFPPYQGHSAQIKQVAWSPDGRTIASASVDKTVQVWSASDGTPIFTYLGHTNEVWAVTWSPNGKLLASGSHDGTVQVWEPLAGSTALIYNGHSDEVNTVAWSPDGRRIASGSGYTQHSRTSNDTTVQVWDTSIGPTDTHLIYRGHANVVEAVAWSPDSTRIASASDDFTVQVWEAA